MTKDELYAFLEEMTPSGELLDSLDDPSWHAHRKAERMADGGLFPLLREIIEERPRKEDTELRRNACFVLGRLLQKGMNTEYCQFFLDRLEKETDKYILDAMLNGIGQLKLPPEVRIDAVIACSRDKWWLVRHSAIHALRASDTDAAREALRYWVGQTEEKKYKYELIYANAALGEIGTPEDIALLEQHIHSRIRDVKDSAAYAVNSIRQRTAGKAFP